MSEDKREFAKILRKNQTYEEKLLWIELRASRFGVRFRRQAIFRGWVVDFYAAEVNLVIEVDGPYHLGRIKQDKMRDAAGVGGAKAGSG